MADKSVGELIAATSVTPTDLFVLEQNGTAKKLTGQILENWLVSFADGHGGIQSIEKIGIDVLADTYRITLADTTTFDFVVTNGRGISSIAKTSTSGLIDTYTITYNDGTKGDFTVANGAKGDKGDNSYIWIKYASQEPTAQSNSFGDVPDNWIGIYFGGLSEAPADWKQYAWFQIKGEKGDTGDPARLISSAVEYQASDSGIIIPSGAWSSSVPVVAQGKYLWTRITNTFNTGSPVVFYSVSRMGLDGSGSVSSVANISPDENGNVPLSAADLNALSNMGGDLTGELRMNGQPISGLNPPTANDHAANMGYVNAQVKKAAPRNLLDNSDFTNLVNQRGAESYTGTSQAYDRWQTRRIAIRATAEGLHITPNNESGMRYLYQRIAQNLCGRKITIAIDGMPAGGFIKIFNLATTTQIAGSEELSVGLNVYTVDIPAGFEDGISILFYIPDNSEATLKWAALYEGEYTLDTLPEYQPKGYAVELAECRRYFRHKENTLLPGFVNASGQGIVVNVESDAPFFNIPQLDIKTITWIRGGGKNITTIPAWTISTYSNNPVSPVYTIDFTEKIDQTVYANVYVYCSYTLSAEHYLEKGGMKHG